MKYLKLLTILLLLPVLTYADFDTSLKYGAKGDKVVELQEFLIEKGFLNSEPTGNFYSLTLKAVKAFQTAYDLPSTGYFGIMSRTKANEILALENNAELEEVGSITAPVDTTINKQLEDLNKTIQAQNAIIEAQRQAQIQSNLILEQIKSNTNKPVPTQPPVNNPPANPPVTPTPPVTPPVAEPVAVSLNRIPKRDSMDLDYFNFTKDVYIKTLKVKIATIDKTEDSDYGIAQVNLDGSSINPLHPNDRNRRLQYAYSSPEKLRPWTDTEFTIEVNRVINSTDILRLGTSGGSNKGNVWKLELQIVGAETVATIPKTETKADVGDITLTLIDNTRYKDGNNQ